MAVDELHKQGIVERVNGPATLIPLLVTVKKPNGELRIHQDLKLVNKAVRKFNWSTPNPDKVLTSMRDAKKMPKIDSNSRPKTTDPHHVL